MFNKDGWTGNLKKKKKMDGQAFVIFTSNLKYSIVAVAALFKSYTIYIMR